MVSRCYVSEVTYTYRPTHRKQECQADDINGQRRRIPEARVFQAILAAVLCVGALCLSPQVEAGTTVSLYKSFSGNLNFVTTGGTRRTQSNDGNNCAVTAAGNTTNMTVSGVPAGSTIVAAYLYWAGSGTLDDTVTFNGTNVTADRTFTDASGGNAYFSGFKDVTSLVSGNGTYTFSNLTVSTGNPWCSVSAVLAAYAMVVVYSNPSENFRVLNVFDGFQLFQGSSITLTPNNFQIPSSPINGKFAVITWEGDYNVSANLGGFGETLQFNGNTLTDICDPTGNQYNSTINTITCTGNEATNGGIYWGLDFDTYDISSYLTAGDTSASTFYSSGQDLVYLSAQIVSVTNTPVSDLSITDSDGASSVVAGSNTTYVLTAINNGPNATTGITTVTDTLPTGETYVSASGTGWTCGFTSPTLNCTRSDSLASGASYPAIGLTVTVGPTAGSPLSNIASVSGGNFDNVSGNNSGTDSDTVTYPADDLQITKVHNGTFTAGANASYTLTVKNNGPIAITSGTTTTVSDTLPAGETFVSGTGTGWSCSAAGQAVTCNTTTSVASGASLPAITLNVLLSKSIGTSVSNTATVANAFISDGTAGNDSSTDTITGAITQPNYSTSTKTWVDLNGGDVNPGDTVEYTITIKDTGGAAGFNLEVTDNIPADISSFSLVSIPAGATNNSTGMGTGSNGTGYLDVTGINVGASGTASIVFDVVVSGSAAPGDAIDNTATIVGGIATATPAAATITVEQSAVPASGNKILYVYDNLTLTRTPQSANTTTPVTVGEASTLDWTLTPALQKALTLNAGTVTVALVTARSGNGGGNAARNFTVELLKNGTTSLGTSGSTGNFTSTTPTLRTLTISIAATGFSVGDTLVLRVHNNSAGGGTRTLAVYQMVAGTGSSTITLNSATVINVDSISMFNAAYSSTSTPPNNVFEPNTTVYIRAVVSDPFGSYDIDPATGGTAPVLTLKDPNGTVQLNAVAMTQVADSGAATKTFEYYVSGTTGYALANNAVEGYWTPSVTATEGTEGTVTHTANGSFEVRRPSLVVTKLVTVLSDPVDGSTRPKSIPGAVEQYSLQVSNAGKGRANAIVITDAVPTNTAFVVGSITFVDGSPTSGMASPTISYDNTSCAGAFTDAASTSAKCLKFAWTTANFMNGKSGATSPSFMLRFNVTLN